MAFQILVPLEMIELVGKWCLYSFHSGKVASGEYIDLLPNSHQARESLHRFAVDARLDSSELDWAAKLS